MKTIFTVIFLTIFSTFSQAQYQSLFGENSTLWNMSVWQWGILEAQPHLTVYYAGNDTLINGQTYKKISPSNYNLSTSYLREDTVEGKAWVTYQNSALNLGETEELLIMDLSLEVGDTFVVSDGHHLPDGYFSPVVDSVYYHEGRKHIRLDFEYNLWNFPGDKLTMIEGVGTNIGTFYQPFLIQPIDYYTLCQTKDGDTLSYVNNSPYFLGRCDVSAVGVDERQKPAYNLHIFPNPANEKIVIEGVNDLVLDKNEGLVLTVSDVTGRLVHHEKVAFFPCELEIAEWPKGLYIITVGNIAIGKFLKN